MSYSAQPTNDKHNNAPVGPGPAHMGANGQTLPDLDGLELEAGEDAIAAPKDVLDDIASLVISSEETVLAGTREIVTNVAVRKPKKDEFFRTHPTAHYGPCAIFEVKVQMSTESYLIVPAVWNVFKGDLLKSHARKVVLRVSITRGGLIFLNPIVAQDPLSKSNEYNDTARESAIAAVTNWVRQEADLSQGKYRVWVAEGVLGKPVWPAFDLPELIKKAFKGRVIASASHELLEQLRGKV
jgi:hypothetical protein